MPAVTPCVALWVVPTAEARGADFLAHLRSVLSDEDHARLSTFGRGRERGIFVLGRALARLALSAEAPAVRPGVWRFIVGPQGRPDVSPHHGVGLSFNVAHTDGLVAVAVARGGVVGIDVESLSRRLPSAVASSFFAPSERATLRGTREGRAEAFFTHWTLKEAYAKARGLGLTLPFARISFEVSNGAARATLDPSLGDDGSSWRFAVRRPTAEHVLAVAVRYGAGDGPLQIEERPPPWGGLA